MAMEEMTVGIPELSGEWTALGMVKGDKLDEISHLKWETLDGKEKFSFPLPDIDLPKVDPITFEVIYNRVRTIATEISTALWRTAYSDIFTETRDYGVGVADSEGRGVGEGRVLINHHTFDQVTLQMNLRMHGLDYAEEGDILMSNDNRYSGIHSQEIFLYAPVFHEGERIAWVWVVVHHIDMGGAAPSSYCPAATDLYMEGVRFPPGFKLYERDKLNMNVLRLILTNVRQPVFQRGDIMGQVAGINTGIRRVKELAAKYGVQTVKDVFLNIQYYTRAVVRKSLEDMPDGRYEAEEYLDAGGATVDTDKSFRIRTIFIKKGDRAIVDLTECDDQTRGFANNHPVMVVGAVFCALHCYVCPQANKAYGTMSPVQIITRKGSIMNPDIPKVPNDLSSCAPAPLLHSTILQCCSQANPALATGTWGGELTVNTAWGYDPKTKRDYVTLLQTGCAAGGQATSMADGWPCNTMYSGDLVLPNVEIEEARYRPLLYRGRWATREDVKYGGGGGGKFRGGGSVTYEIECRYAPISFSISTSRYWHSSPGVAGGRPANVVRNELRDAKTGKVKTVYPPKVQAETIQPGERLRVVTAGAGGYGPPLDRDIDLVVKDIRNGWYGVKWARDVYGVMLDRKTFKVNIDATRKLRAAKNAELGEQ